MKKFPNFEIGWPAPATPRALNIKGVYVVGHSWYGQIIVPVCSFSYFTEETTSNSLQGAASLLPPTTTTATKLSEPYYENGLNYEGESPPRTPSPANLIILNTPPSPTNPTNLLGTVSNKMILLVTIIGLKLFLQKKSFQNVTRIFFCKLAKYKSHCTVLNNFFPQKIYILSTVLFF